MLHQNPQNHKKVKEKYLKLKKDQQKKMHTKNNRNNRMRANKTSSKHNIKIFYLVGGHS
jgi:hypothetical protein